MDTFQGKVALIIGSLHSTGADMAELLVNAGAEVVCTDNDHVVGCALAQQLGTAALFLPLDGLPEERLHILVAKTINAFGRLDVLVIPLPEFNDPFSRQEKRNECKKNR